MAISKELQRKLDYYEQVYFATDKPIPFKDDLMLYPVLAENYYDFYGAVPCITADKSIITVIDEDGRQKKISNPKGLAQTYMSYLIEKLEGQEGQVTTMQLMQLFELVFHIKRGAFCPHCGKEIPYSDLFKDIDNKIEQRTDELYNSMIVNKTDNIKDVDENILSNLKEKIRDIARREIMAQSYVCPDCNNQMRDIFSVKTNNETGQKLLVVKNTEINSKEFDEFKAIVPRQNILDYEGDKYMNPDLKEELEIKAKLKNSDYTSPTLEKQMSCIVAGTSYKYEELYKLPIRKIAYLLRTIDKKNTYYAQIQGAMSGMVKFKEDPKHWIFSDDKHNIRDELTDYGKFADKFQQVV